MPRIKSNAGAASKAGNSVKIEEPEKSLDVEDKVELVTDEDLEETMEEEVEYEEVEEEVEEETDEEVEEVEEVEEDDEEDDASDEDTAAMKGISKDEKKKHAELLAVPPHGSEVFVGGIPSDATEEDLREFCEPVGEVVEVRVMKGKNATENKGYAFVMFKTKELASEAMEKLNNAELKGKKIKCSSSQAKQKLFVGNISKSWSEKDLRKAVTKAGPGVMAIELLKDAQNSSRNRGFAFIEYYNHACAEYSRQKMSSPNFKLDKNSPTVSWADPKKAESSTTPQAKAIYVKNLPRNVTDDDVKELFGQHGKIAKVALPPAKPGHENSRYGFVHYVDSSSTTKALHKNERYELHGRVLECSLAKPLSEHKAGIPSSQKSTSLPTYSTSLPTYSSHVGYGLPGGGMYPALGAGYAPPGLPQPLMYGMGGPPPGAAMMPMLLPDGRIAYLLQQPGMHIQTPMQSMPGRGGGGRSSRGGSSGGRRRGGDNNYSRGRYNPY